MQRLSGTILLGTALGALALGACANGGDEGILVTKNVVPGVGCVFLGDPTEEFFSSGTVNTHSNAGYLFAPQLESRVTAPMTDTQDRTIITTGANVDITFADTTFGDSLALDPSLTHFSQPFSVQLPPITAGVETVADGQFTMIPQAIIDAINNAMPGLGSANAPNFQTLLLVEFQVLGTMAGTDVSSQKFDYGVTVGNHVLVDDLGDCPITNGATILPGDPCNLFQDEQVSCCRDPNNPDPNNNLICPAATQ